MVAMTVSMPIYGKLGDLYGRRRLMLFAIVVFTAASLLCGLAQSMGQLVLARVLQGVGAGGLMAVSQAIIGDIVPPRERGRYQGYFSSMYAIASVAGPVLGGLLTEYLSWRWVFWINLPIGLLALAISRRTLVGLPVPRRQPVIDYLGIVLMVVGLTALLLAITQIGQGAAWSDPALLGLFALAALALLLFVAQERRFREPLVPMQLFAVRAATLSWLVAFFASFQAISLTVLVPLRYQSVTGAGADSAALHLLPLVMGLPLGAYCCGRLTASLGRYKPLILLGAVLLPCGIAGLALVPVGDHWLSGLCMLLTGIAIGTQFPTSLVAAQNAVEQRHIGVATSKRDAVPLPRRGGRGGADVGDPAGPAQAPADRRRARPGLFRERPAEQPGRRQRAGPGDPPACPRGCLQGALPGQRGGGAARPGGGLGTARHDPARPRRDATDGRRVSGRR
ncbi:MFS family transporter [Pseudomonas aeruginosa]|nr:MFS family transporter [Pseudomonas aeruginosa]